MEPFHVDFNRRIFMGVLCNAMLNAAGKHSHNRGWGIPDLMKEGYTWVLSRFSVEFGRMPEMGETCNIATWVNSAIRLFTNRYFRIDDAEGTPIAYCRSVWAMINVETRKPADLLTFRNGELNTWKVSEEEAPCPIADMRPIRNKEATLARSLQTYYSDVDINGHINSVKYIEHIVNLFTNEELTRGIRRIDIAYKAEAYQGDTLLFFTHREDANTLLVDVRKENGDVCVQSRILLHTAPQENNEDKQTTK